MFLVHSGSKKMIRIVHFVELVEKKFHAKISSIRRSVCAEETKRQQNMIFLAQMCSVPTSNKFGLAWILFSTSSTKWKFQIIFLDPELTQKKKNLKNGTNLLPSLGLYESFVQSFLPIWCKTNSGVTSTIAEKKVYHKCKHKRRATVSVFEQPS